MVCKWSDILNATVREISQTGKTKKGIEITTLIKVWKREHNYQKYYSNFGLKLRRDIVHRKNLSSDILSTGNMFKILLTPRSFPV